MTLKFLDYKQKQKGRHKLYEKEVESKETSESIFVGLALPSICSFLLNYELCERKHEEELDKVVNQDEEESEEIYKLRRSSYSTSSRNGRS